LEFRRRIGEEWFADVSFEGLQSDPVDALSSAYDRLGIELGEGRRPVQEWARAHPPNAQGAHEFSLDEFGLDAPMVADRFESYLERFAVPD
jgi:hypothetical protein